jgi:hypothetical protein
MWGGTHRVRIGLLYRPARLHRLAELVPWNRFLGPWYLLSFKEPRDRFQGIDSASQYNMYQCLAYLCFQLQCTMPLNVINNCGGGGRGGRRRVFKYARYPLFMFGLRNAALQSALGRPGELLFLDLDFVLLASSRDPNFTGRHLF